MKWSTLKRCLLWHTLVMEAAVLQTGNFLLPPPLPQHRAYSGLLWLTEGPMKGKSWSSDQSVQHSSSRELSSGSARWPGWRRAPGRARVGTREAAGPNSQEPRREKRGKSKASLPLPGTGHGCRRSCSWNSRLRNLRETESWINGQCIVTKCWKKLIKYTGIYKN